MAFSNISFVVLLSKDAKISSNKYISALEYNALANDILLLWPPDKDTPFSPIWVFYPYVKTDISSFKHVD